jgi:hypothetical protein
LTGPEGPSAALEGLLVDMERDLAAAAVTRDHLAWGLGQEAWRAQDPMSLAFVAVQLHHWYGSIESCLERVARVVDGSLPAGPRWHTDLLLRMAGPMPGVRDALLSSGSVDILRQLLGFRHFFRHAYGVAWRAMELERHARVVLGPEGEGVHREIASWIQRWREALRDGSC